MTLLLVVAVPFCCCNFRSLLSTCSSCQAAPVADEPEASHDRSHDSDHDLAAPHQHATGHKQHEDGQSSVPCGPGDEKHHCNCEKNDGKMLTVQKSTVELPMPVVVAILDWSMAADMLPPAAIRVQYRGSLAIARPPTSLLRQHCALIV
ncbi:MAG TPA: hypothetical protein PKE29_02865 [Phycisphaerales bacterium]|nr:hypothetical protein [Phycisphaerales bacterium]